LRGKEKMSLSSASSSDISLDSIFFGTVGPAEVQHGAVLGPVEATVQTGSVPAPKLSRNQRRKRNKKRKEESIATDTPVVVAPFVVLGGGRSKFEHAQVQEILSSGNFIAGVDGATQKDVVNAYTKGLLKVGQGLHAMRGIFDERFFDSTKNPNYVGKFGKWAILTHSVTENLALANSYSPSQLSINGSIDPERMELEDKDVTPNRHLTIVDGFSSWNLLLVAAVSWCASCAFISVVSIITRYTVGVEYQALSYVLMFGVGCAALWVIWLYRPFKRVPVSVVVRQFMKQEVADGCLTSFQFDIACRVALKTAVSASFYNVSFTAHGDLARSIHVLVTKELKQLNVTVLPDCVTNITASIVRLHSHEAALEKYAFPSRGGILYAAGLAFRKAASKAGLAPVAGSGF
jgi:hypothetical protein